jgi:tetratricopeptide (TPR) repeat protein
MFSKTEQGNMSIELTGLDRDSAWKLAQSLNARDSVKLVEGSHGHPLLLNLMARGGAVQAKGDVVSFIEREVYSSLSADEMSLLELLSVYRHPVPVEALKVRDYGLIANMRRKALVTEQEEGVWTHDLLREFFASHMASEDRVAMHRIAAEYCERQDGVEWSLEALHHWIESGEWGGAYRVAIAGAVELAKEFPAEANSYLSRMDLSKLSARERAEILFIRGQIGQTLGMHETALSDFEDSLQFLGDADPSKKALVLGAKAAMQSEAQRWNESLSSHQNALRIYERFDDREGQAREWMNIGGVYRRKGDFPRARNAYEKALFLSTKAENRTSQAACLNNLGLLEWNEGKLGEAEIRLKESARLAHTVKDNEGEANGLENLAGLYRAGGRLTEATSVYLESAEAFLRADDVSEFKRLQSLAAEALGMLGKFEKGIELCEKAFARPELRRRRGLFQRSPRYDAGDLSLSHALAELLRGAGDPRRAQKELARYATIADALGDPSLKARGRLLLSIIREEIGELDASLEALSEAEALLKSAGNHEGLVAVYIRKGIVEEKRGNYEAAAEQYRNAAQYAERVEDKTALRIALESLKSVS